MPNAKILENYKFEDEICSYGCEEKASYAFSNGKFCCSESFNKCKAIKNKNSLGLKKAYADGRKNTTHLDGHRGWAKGYTKDTHPSVKAFSEKLKGQRRITDEERLKKIEYKEKCQFNFSNEFFSYISGYDLLKEYGMYHRINNKNGVVRDHIISVEYGWKNNIDPFIISHPANCQFLKHVENAKKGVRSDLRLDELLEKITIWEDDGNLAYLLE